MPAQNITVLLVDDNPMVASMMRDSLAPLAHVTVASDAADALVKAVEHPPDLIVCDYSLPGMDGAQFAARLKAGSTASIPFVLLISKSETDALAHAHEYAEEVIEKPFFVRDAVARIRRVLDRIALERMAEQTRPGGAIRGSLSHMSVLDLVQSLQLGRKSCALRLSSGPESAELFVEEGEIIDATCGGLRGDDVVYRTLTWPSGEFEIDFEGRSSQHTTTRSTEALLMEGLRLLDEANRDHRENVLEP
jgi:CheY-like chemotaxis protein